MTITETPESKTTEEIKALPEPLTRIKLDVVKTSWLWLGLSVLLTIPGLVFMVLSIMHYPNHSPVKLGIDFTGGMMSKLAFEKTLQQDDVAHVTNLLLKMGIQNPVVQTINLDKPIITKGNELYAPVKRKAVKAETQSEKNPPKAKSLRDEIKQLEAKAKADKAQELKNNQPIALKSVLSIRTRSLTPDEANTLKDKLNSEIGRFLVQDSEQIGPTLAKELFAQSGLGLLLVFGMILIYLTIRFQTDYAVMAIIAMAHDAIFVVGTFSMLGWLFNIEVNSMFVTAVLTVIGFSVHDTIVVFDRLRENTRRLYTQKLSINTLVNLSVNQTFARSLNTSLTALLTLSALYFFGGESTKEFLLALILGIAVGTYSSIFVASTLLAWWRNRGEKKLQTQAA